ncbi:MAG: helix-turn-helix transcriptional regulator [Eubacterium sp.]|nr:helix-turn-helix transcriptional regulator [Eubacterium sp.]
MFLSEGRSNGEIAEILQLSENTVRFHISNVLKKTGMKDRNEVNRAYRL